jgi:FAD/FMN-containing dehydrogenase/Fe-S oxidoreductase
MVLNAIPKVSSPSPVPDGREIPFNYTSADDRRIVALLLGNGFVQLLENLSHRRVTGRSARLLSRCLGEIMIHRRNPYLYQEMVNSASRRKRFFTNTEKDLEIIERNSDGNAEVLKVLRGCRDVLAQFHAQVRETPGLRRRLKHELGSIVGPRNVCFDPFTLVSHATDATDWRLHLPVAVVTPCEEDQVAPLLVAIGQLGLKAIPRGAGTGLTGGAVPLHPECVIINTEKLNRIRGVAEREFHLADSRVVQAAVLEVEAGVITEKAMDYAETRGLVFATDPTSAWASTIGGNISENAGGKVAVRWGTCIDNLVAWRMAMPGGSNWTIRRVDHQLRKILPGDLVTFDVTDGDGKHLRRIRLRDDEIRKKGLWKDITNKALGGLPGIQKEGTDGVITSAEFVLHPEFAAKRTLCLEFFGPDMDEASRVILELSKAFPFPDEGHEALLALEHFDDAYVRAIGYKVKAPRPDTPKAVLLVDVAGHDAEDVLRGIQKVQEILDRFPNKCLFVARDAAEAKRFWADRKKLGAIAKRTNAFKLNEDVVIPLEALADFARFVDQINEQEERYAQLQFLDRAEIILASAAGQEGELPSSGMDAALDRCRRGHSLLSGAAVKAIRSMELLDAIRAELTGFMQGYPDLSIELERAHQAARDRRIVLATHMHAGDGNVHVNVPVLSNDPAMLRRADQIIDRVMAKVVALGGVVSGEHGIGVTKLKYLEKSRIENLAAYRREVDPQGLMNPGKLEDFEALEQIFTPSFNLLELEASILQHGQLEDLAKKIAHCVRCGKCKPECGVFHPARGMFFHPRNKNLAIGSLIEAMLYDTQRERSTHFELLQWLEEVADHCTICHKCEKPCPVGIDTGEVSVLERETLANWGYKKTPLATQLTLAYLNSRSPFFNLVFRTSVLQAGGFAQRLGSTIAAPVQPKEGPSPWYPLRLLRSPLPTVPPGTLRDVLPTCEPDQVLVFEPTEEAATTVFYFPGCGSERLHSNVSMAAIHVLLEAGCRVVVPPPFLCCGFPAHVNAKRDQHSHILLRDTILFSQIRAMFAHLIFDACIVTCGTCMEGLEAMGAGRLFGGRVMDLAPYARERGLRLEGGEDVLYHAPCHDSLNAMATQLFDQLGGFGNVETVPHCCSEAGTLALSRPDITDAMLHRKRNALQQSTSGRAPIRLLTNCPSCLQGLGRNRDLGIEPCHLAVALAEKRSGKAWMKRFQEQAQRADAFTF